MTNPFLEKPILTSPYKDPSRHWELDQYGQPTPQVLPNCRPTDFITPIPKPQECKGSAGDQGSLAFDEGKGLSTTKQLYSHTAVINGMRQEVDTWRRLPQSQWRVNAQTARLRNRWRSNPFSSFRPFFYQVEAVETAIRLTEVESDLGKAGQHFLEHLKQANADANPKRMRLARKLAEVINPQGMRR